MKFTPELAQSIVDRIRVCMPHRILITDHNSIIVGATETSRVGEYNPLAAKVLATGEAVDVHYDGHSLPPREGTGIPLVFEGKVLGMIGIGGPPSVVRGYAYISKVLVELMLEREALRELDKLREMVRKSFISNLLYEDVQRDELWRERAGLLNIDTDIPRTAVVAEIASGKRQPQAGAVVLEDAELIAQKSKVAFYRIVEDVFVNPQDLIVELQHSSQVAILVSMDHPDSGARQRRLEFLLEHLRKQVRLVLGLNLTLGISEVLLGAPAYREGFAEATEALAIGKRLYGEGGTYDSRALKLERLVATVSPVTGEFFQEEIFRKLKTCKAEETLLLTLDSLFRNGLDISRTAKSLHVHRNTVQYRMRKIRQLTGLDMRDPRHLLVLGMAVFRQRYADALGQ